MHYARALLTCSLLAATSAGCASAGSPPSAGAAPGAARRPGSSYAFYEVHGSTAAELHSSMLRAGPKVNGHSRFGSASWDVTWNARWELGRTGCEVTRLDMRLRAEALLPQWTPPAGADPALVGSWAAFERALAEHEEGHLDVGRSAERELRSQLRQVSAPRCALLENQLRAVSERILDAHRRRDLEYDERTRHGEIAGAVWPPRAVSPARGRTARVCMASEALRHCIAFHSGTRWTTST